MSNLIDSGRGYPAIDLDPYVRRLNISFAPNGSSAIDAAGNQGAGGLWSVARVSQGLYRITLRDGYRVVAYFGAELQFNAPPITLRAVPGPVVNTSTTRTFDVFVVDGAGAVQDAAANPNNRINVNLVLRCTELKA